MGNLRLLQWHKHEEDGEDKAVSKWSLTEMLDCPPLVFDVLFGSKRGKHKPCTTLRASRTEPNIIQELLLLRWDAGLRSDSSKWKSFRLLEAFLKPSRFTSCCFQMGLCSRCLMGENSALFTVWVPSQPIWSAWSLGHGCWHTIYTGWLLVIGAQIRWE